MLIAMAGLPGTGKTTLASALARETGGVVLGKDPVRAALFPGPALDYSTEQDDLTMAAIYAAAGHLRKSQPRLCDPRRANLSPSVSGAQSSRALREARRAARVIECVCNDVQVRQRLEDDLGSRPTPGPNRTFELYQQVKTPR